MLDDQDAGDAGFQAVERNPVGPHESNQLAQGDPPILAARYPISTQLAAVEPLRHGSRSDAADLCDLSRGQHVFCAAHDTFLESGVAIVTFAWITGCDA